MNRRSFLTTSLASSAWVLAGQSRLTSAAQSTRPRSYSFHRTISRTVLDNYLSRSICMEGMLHGRGDLADDIRMLSSTGAKYIARSVCLWGKESNLLNHLEEVRQNLPRMHAADPDTVLEACIFEIITTEVEQVPVPDWAFSALKLPVEKRNFRYADIAYADGPRKDQWGKGSSVPDVSRPETKLWFYFLAKTYIDLGVEGVHFGQVEIMNANDPDLAHWEEVFTLVRAYAAKHARRQMVLCNGHVPSGGLLRNGKLLLDFHAFPLRVKETPDHPQEAVLEMGYKDTIYSRSKGGKTYSGWSCEHLPYIAELDNWGASHHPGEPNQGQFWVWGYDEISWFAQQPKEYRAKWLRYAWNWIRKNDSAGHLEMPGSRTMVSPLDHRRWYYANRPGPAVPDGLDDEAAIREIWASDNA